MIYSVSQKIPLRFSGIFPNGWEFFVQIFARLLYVPIYARLHICIQLSATLTKLCYCRKSEPVLEVCMLLVLFCII